MQVTITYLTRMGAQPCDLMDLPDGFILTHEKLATPDMFRDLYYQVGDKHFWWERRLWTEEQWLALSEKDSTELWILTEKDSRCGFFELDFGESPKSVDLSFFGLYENYIGRGIGKILLSHAINRLQKKPCLTMRVNTCDLDHSSALNLYKNFGFIPQDIEKKEITDPRQLGIINPDLPLPEHYGKDRL